MFGKRILILAAHPDDEVVACGASLGRAQAQGAVVAVLYLTHGCLAKETMWAWQRHKYEKVWQRRRHEAEKVASLLGFQSLGFVERPARHLWCNLSSVWEDIEKGVSDFRPDQIWVPAYEGGNPDHDALNAMGSKLKGRVSVLEFAEYNYFGHKPQSHTFISVDETVRVISLTPEEKALKRKALSLYASEAANLSSLKIVQESYRPLYSYDYARPPHQGILWYERFRWVPFRHPRIDWTPCENISQAIKDFFS